jgi:TolB-like protein
VADVAVIRFGAYRIHPTQGLSHGDREIRVTPKSLAVLYTLASRAPHVVTKAELFDTVWSGRVVSDAALSSCIRELRIALGDDAGRPEFIETVHRRGFRLLSAADEPHAQAGIGIVEETGAAAVERSEATRFATAQPSIVVLPFQTISLETPERFLARGLVHDVITRIARSRLMFIIARGTAFQFEHEHQDVKAIGRQLGVRYVVQGAVQIAGSRVKVSVALASAESGEELWSEQYQRRLADFLALQEDIAALIVASLESEVEREEMQRSMLMPSSNLDAWSAYHRGIHYMYRFREEDCKRAETLFRRSIAIEPDVPRPYAGLSFINFERVFLNFCEDPAEGIHRAVDYAEQSLSIDSRDPMGHWALSRAYLLQGNLEASKRSLQTAIEMNPSYAIAQYSLGWVALQLGENELCLNRVGFARRLSPNDPLSFAMLGVYALNLALMGRTGEAAELSVQSTHRPNAHYQALAFAAVTHALDGRRDEARAFLERIHADRPGYGFDDFMTVYRFQRERDIELIRKAFRDMRRHESRGK